jgi:hypothetical protein
MTTEGGWQCGAEVFRRYNGNAEQAVWLRPSSVVYQLHPLVLPVIVMPSIILNRLGVCKEEQARLKSDCDLHISSRRMIARTRCGPRQIRMPWGKLGRTNDRLRIGKRWASDKVVLDTEHVVGPEECEGMAAQSGIVRGDNDWMSLAGLLECHKISAKRSAL